MHTAVDTTDGNRGGRTARRPPRRCRRPRRPEEPTRTDALPFATLPAGRPASAGRGMRFVRLGSSRASRTWSSLTSHFVRVFAARIRATKIKSFTIYFIIKKYGFIAHVVFCCLLGHSALTIQHLCIRRFVARFRLYGCEDRKKDCELRGDTGAIGLIFTPCFRKYDHHPKKKKRFSQEMHLKIRLLSPGLKLSNSKPGFRVSAPHFFVKQIPPMAF